MGVAEKALEWAKSKVGCGYSQDKRNATNPDYFDCSSLVARAYKAAGYRMAQTVSAYEVSDPGFDLIWPTPGVPIGQKFGTLAQIKNDGWKPTPGDLIFYCHNKDTTRKNKITHVAFVLDSKHILHARNPTLGVLVNDITLYDGTICAVTRFDEVGRDAAPERDDDFDVVRVLKLMEGEDVRELQNALIARDYDCGIGGATGVYDEATAQAVKAFQRDAGLVADGKAGEKTIQALGGSWEGVRGKIAVVKTPSSAPISTENSAKPSGTTIRMLMTKTTGEVKTMALEEYLRGVVPSEVSASWPAEALKAQAIAARTYALKRIESRKSNAPYDVDDTSAYQAYNVAKTHVLTDAAIKATAGVVLTYGGKIAEAVYCASNGGKTVSAMERWGNAMPYLVAQADPFDTNAKSGHGVGLSQRGAKARAEAGQTCEQILAFYYLGASASRKA